MSSRPAGTESFAFNHTMFRIKDPNVSLKWYQDVLGMTLLREAPGGDFTNYFLAFTEPGESASAAEKRRFSREGVLELCHNWGTEKDDKFGGYKSGNETDHKGFGHIAITVDDLQKACDRFEKLGVTFQKRPSDGKMKNIAFIKDPDGYWVEILHVPPDRRVFLVAYACAGLREMQ